jgi:hypothetical protein
LTPLRHWQLRIFAAHLVALFPILPDALSCFDGQN